jgi:hypothetical protein
VVGLRWWGSACTGSGLQLSGGGGAEGGRGLPCVVRMGRYCRGHVPCAAVVEAAAGRQAGEEQVKRGGSLTSSRHCGRSVIADRRQPYHSQGGHKGTGVTRDTGRRPKQPLTTRGSPVRGGGGSKAPYPAHAGQRHRAECPTLRSDRSEVGPRIKIVVSAPVCYSYIVQPTVNLPQK